MKLDERGARAAADLLERAARRPIPAIEDLVAPPRRRLPSRRLLAVAAAIALVVTATVVITRRDEGLPQVEHLASMPVPVGITPQHVTPAGMGVAMELPSTWQRSTETRGFAVGYQGDEGWVSVSRIATTDPLDADAMADLRSDLLVRNIHAEVGDAARTTIDGHDAVVLEVRWQGTISTEYSIDLEDSTWAVVNIGERMPRDEATVTDWVASTIAVESTPLWSTPIEHPSTPLPPPEGIAPRTWAPAGEGFTIDLPATWDVPSEPRPAGFDVGMESTSGPLTWAFGARVSHALGDAEGRRRVLERQFHARIVEADDTVVDGRATQVLRYRFPTFDEPRLANLCVEYDIELGTDSVYLALCTAGGSPADLLEWIRSTIRVTP